MVLISSPMYVKGSNTPNAFDLGLVGTSNGAPSDICWLSRQILPSGSLSTPSRYCRPEVA